MNIRLDQDELTLVERIDTHLRVMASIKRWAFTGRYALLPNADYPGAFQVWCETDEGTWVWVNPEGVVVERFCPMDAEHP